MTAARNGRLRRLLAAAAFLAVTTAAHTASAQWVDPVRVTGASSNRVDLVFVGEGYTASELGSGKFASDVERFLAKLFAADPYREYEGYYNVWRVSAPSAESGADDPARGRSVSTAFDATYGCGGVEAAICVDGAKVLNALGATDLPFDARDQIVVLVNDAAFGGSGGALAVASLHPQAVELVRREFERSFAKLTGNYDALDVLEQHVLHLYNLVSPIDAWSPLASSLEVRKGDPAIFSVAVPQPSTHALAIEWRVDGVAAGTGDHISPALGVGTHTVTVTVSDSTGFVRTDPDGVLGDTHAWVVTVDPANGSSTGSAGTNQLTPSGELTQALTGAQESEVSALTSTPATFSRAITIDRTKVGGSTLTDFPMVFAGTYPYLATVAHGGKVEDPQGDDIQFTADAAGTVRLNWEVESYDPVTGTVAIWVRVPTVSASTNTTVYVWYGNPGVTTFQGNATAVWASSYRFVGHLGNDGTGLVSTHDSTSLQTDIDFRPPPQRTTLVAGKVGGAAGMDGVDDHGGINFAPTLGTPPASTWTLEVWVNPANFSTVQTAWYVGNDAGGYGLLLGDAAGTRGAPAGAGKVLGLFGSVAWMDSGYTLPAANAWYHLQMERANGVTRIYVCGVPTPNTSAATPNTPAVSAGIGAQHDPSFVAQRFLTGAVDEPRLSNVARGGGWATASCNSQSTTTFYAVGTENGMPNPVPTITTISPASAPAGSGPVTVTVTGTGFVANSMARFGGADRVTTVTSASSLTMTLLAADTASQGTGSVTVFTPTPGGGTSNAATFTITAPVPNPVPSITTITPSSVPAGSGAVTIAVTGTGFVASSVARVNGIDHATTVSSSTSLTMTLLASDTASQGTGSITVFSPLPGGGTSNGVTLTITAPVGPATYSRALTIDRTKVGGSTLTDFPMVFAGTYPYLATVAHGGKVEDAQGDDIQFTADAAGTVRLNWEVESYDPVTGTVAIWVRVPTVSASTNTTVYVWYGNPGVTTFQGNATAVWASSYRFVGHLGNDGTGLVSTHDSTSLQTDIDFRPPPQRTTLVAGKVGGAAGMDGVDDHGGINFAPTLGTPPASTWTLEVWVNPANFSTVQTAWYVGNDAGGYGLLLGDAAGTRGAPAGAGKVLGLFGSVAWMDSGYTLPAANAWYHLQMERANGVTRIYVCGVPTPNTSAATPNTPAVSAGIGAQHDPSFVPQRFLTGAVDEPRLSNVARGGGWATASCNNQSTSTFYAVGTENGMPNPAPTITTIGPSSAPAGSGAVTVTVTGTGFVATSVARVNGADRATTVSSSTSLTMTLLASDTASQGTGSITVFTPTPGGGTSNAATFTTTALLPSITTITPSSAPAGSGPVTVTVTGTGFVANSVARLGGADRVTTVTSATSLTITLVAADTASQGTGSITVFTPTPGGGTSNAATFTTTAPLPNPVPAITTINPSSAPAGSGVISVTVTGTGFVASSVGRFGGVDRVTTVTSATSLTITLLASDTASQGTGSITVFSPTPGGGTSNAATFTTTAPNPVPSITTISPSSVPAGSGAIAVTVTGTGFVASSVGRINGVSRATVINSSTSLTMTLLAGDTSTAGSASITVFSPTPGGGTSNATSFTINAPVPSITTISPSSVPAGSGAIAVTVTGTGFVASSVGRINGVSRTTVITSSTSLTMTLLAGDTSTAGSAPITVFSPTPGGGTSNAKTITITPVITGPAIYSRAVTIDRTKVGGSTLTDFPMVFAGTYPYLATVAHGGKVEDAQGDDIQFTADAAGTVRLNWEVESYDAVTGTVAIWVRVPTVSAAANTTVYVWYGNPGVTTFQGNATAVWASSYRFVGHLGNDGTGLVSTHDSTSLQTDIDFRPPPQRTTLVAGKVGGAAGMDGVDDHGGINFAPTLGTPPASTWTLEVWVNPANFSTVQTAWYVGNDAGGYGLLLGDAAGTRGAPAGAGKVLGLFGSVAWMDSGYTLPAANAWYHLQMERANGVTRIYVCGVPTPNTSAATPNTPAVSAGIGAQHDPSFVAQRFLTGAVDEPRLSNVARGGGWATASCNSQSTTTFYAVGTEVGST